MACCLAVTAAVALDTQCGELAGEMRPGWMVRMASTSSWDCAHDSCYTKTSNHELDRR